MKNLLLLLFVTAFSFTASANHVEPQNSWTITIQLDANICNSRTLAAQINAQLDAIYAQVGSNIAIFEINGYSWETVANVPLCHCRKDNALAIVNNWETSKGLPLSVSSITSCNHNPVAGVATYQNWQKIVIKVEAFL